MKTYLAGPINGCTDEECKDWRSYVSSRLNDTIDPMVRDYRGREAECYAEIVELDKQDIDDCSVLLVNYDKPSVGTSMEVLYAWERKKTVFVVTRPDTTISPWLRYHATEIFHTFDDAISAIARTGERESESADHHYLFCAMCGKSNSPIKTRS